MGPRSERERDYPGGGVGQGGWSVLYLQEKEPAALDLLLHPPLVRYLLSPWCLEQGQGHLTQGEI